jgi:hypothetical protein
MYKITIKVQNTDSGLYRYCELNLPHGLHNLTPGSETMRASAEALALVLQTLKADEDDCDRGKVCHEAEPKGGQGTSRP